MGYINLHGTATPQNDATEIKAVRTSFWCLPSVALSSTKHKTGHCLGAAGAIEAFICEQVLKDQSWLPLHQNVEIESRFGRPKLCARSRVNTAHSLCHE
ncbi:hypothetical protein [Pseudomonas aeruginosa]|uniref:hypothetical protein n=1 Tax=Pseudomonas aeruginosa TaxID=287 RepID=UPI0033373513